MSEELISKMQDAVRDYLVPEPYSRKSPGGTCPHDSVAGMPPTYAAESNIEALRRKRAQMFIADMIYFLDSEEQGTNVRKVAAITCSYCKGGTDENVTHCPVCEGSGTEPS